jgi:uncharacterized cupin superfamily protein
VTVPEARLEQRDEGVVVSSDGWFVLNLADAVWKRNEKGGEYSDVEPEGRRFEQYGIGVHVLQPGQPNGLYHAENVQEDFLVLSGECVLLIEEEERRLQPFDFVHCAPGTHHIFVGAGDGPCAILMVGARGEGKTLHYPVSELAAKYDASASEDTENPHEAYREWPGGFEPVRASWPPGERGSPGGS